MSKPIKSIFILAFLLLLSFTSCDQKKKTAPEESPEFDAYINAYSSGNLLVSSEIRINLNFKPDQDIIREHPELFDFNPRIKGNWQLENGSSIVFKPDEKLKPDQEYKAEFMLGKLIEIPDKLSSFPFEFRTMAPKLHYYNRGIAPYAENPRLQKYTASIQANDIIENEVIEQIVEARIEGKEVGIEWLHQSDGRNHDFIIDSIRRTNEDKKLLIHWDGSGAGITSSGTDTVIIPRLGKFRLMDIKTIQQPDQYVLLRFSDPISPDQNLDGLIRLNGEDDLIFSVYNNEIRVFPEERQEGKKIIRIEQGVSSELGGRLTESIKREVSFEKLKPAVKLTGSAVIMPDSKGLNLPFRAVNLSAVDVSVIKIFQNNIGQFLQNNSLNNDDNLKPVGRPLWQKTIRLDDDKTIDPGQWNTYSLDLSALIEKDPGAIYNVEIAFRPSYSLFECQGNDFSGEENGGFAGRSDDYWDNPDAYSGYYPYGYGWRERDNPCHGAYYNRGRFVSSNILASNLGIIAKGGTAGKMLFAVNDLRTTEPMANIEIEVYNYQQQKIATGKTDASGMVEINLEKQPFYLIAKKDGERGYMRLDDGNSLSLSKFDISGSKIKEGFNSYIYGERGVWRPGDSLFLTFILQDKMGRLPEKHPVIFELIDPRGKQTVKMIRTDSQNGFYNFSTKTQPEAPTGNWTANVKLGDAVFSKQLKIETVKPNRLKIELDLEEEMIVAGEPQNAHLNARWLHGADAENMKARVNVIFTKSKAHFEAYRNYTFSDPSKRYIPEEKNIFEGKTNEQGTVNFTIDFPSEKNAPGLLHANFTTKVFEAGGDFSINYTQIPYAPYKFFAGLHLPESSNKYNIYYTDSIYRVQTAAIDPQGRAAPGRKIELTIYRINWRWWWDASSDDIGAYSSSLYNRKVSSQTSTTDDKGKAYFNIQIDKSDWGRYLVLVKDLESGHSAGKAVYFDWPGWFGRKREGIADASTMLAFSSDKEKYSTGEICKITIPNGGVGRALISIENGSSVIQAEWLETSNGQNSYQFEITPEMAPNIYVHATLIQPHAQTVNDHPIRLYGVVPLEVESPESILHPQIDMPHKIRPEEEFSVKVSEKNGRPMTYTIAIVDEGLLDLTNFKTPDPHNKFYSRQALGVKTWDLYDQVIGAYGGTIEKMFAIGGDESIQVEPKKKANRFKPVVMFKGPFELEGGEQKHHFKMPNYIGSVRTMVVAGNTEGAYGHQDQATPVKKPLMVLATMPRVLSPGESLVLPVTVFAMEENIKKADLNVECNELFTLKNKHQKVMFNATGDQLIEFELQVKEKIGIGKIKVTASSGNEVSTHSIEVDVRNPNPYISNRISKVLAENESAGIQYTYPGMEGTNSGILEISDIPPIDLSRRLKYLIRYPYGCAEQTISSVFPQVFLNSLTELDPDDQMKIDNNIIAGISKIASFQMSNGGFTMWPGLHYANDWVTSYAGHFMIEAEKQGYELPGNFLDDWLSYQQTAVNAWSPYHRDHRGYYRQSDLTQAYRLFTLSLSGNPEFGAMNRLKEKGDLSLQAAWLLAASYAKAGQPEVAEKIIGQLPAKVDTYKYMSSSFGSDLRDRAFILLTLSMLNKEEKAFMVMEQMAKELSSDSWLSTQTTAMSLVAVAEFMRQHEKGSGIMTFSVEMPGEQNKTIETASSIFQLNMPVENLKGRINIQNKSENRLFFRLHLNGQPLIGDQSAAEENLDLSVNYYLMNGEMLDIDSLRQGTDFYAKVSVSNPGMLGEYENMVIHQVFPSGWEVNNLRLFDLDVPVETDRATYQNIRDDRVYTYFDIGPNKKKSFVVLLNASYLGRFYLPSVQSEAMYNHAINARKPGRWVSVVKP